jgi:hypothetical protein
MSTAVETPPKVMPPEVGNVLAAWWMGIGSALVLAGAVWPLLMEALPVLNWVLYGVAALALLALGGFVAVGLKAGKPGAFRLFKIGTIIGMLAGLAFVALVVMLVVNSSTKITLLPDAWPSKALPGTLLGIAALLPFVFAMLALSLTTADAVRDYFSADLSAGDQLALSYPGGAAVGQYAQPTHEEMGGVTTEADHGRADEPTPGPMRPVSDPDLVLAEPGVAHADPSSINIPDSVLPTPPPAQAGTAPALDAMEAALEQQAAEEDYGFLEVEDETGHGKDTMIADADLPDVDMDDEGSGPKKGGKKR